MVLPDPGQSCGGVPSLNLLGFREDRPLLLEIGRDPERDPFGGPTVAI